MAEIGELTFSGVKALDRANQKRQLSNEILAYQKIVPLVPSPEAGKAVMQSIKQLQKDLMKL